MKIHWVALVAVVALGIAIDTVICQWLRGCGYKWLASINALLAGMTVLAVAALAAMPLGSATTSNSTFVVGQYLLYGVFVMWVPKALGLAAYALARLLRRKARRIPAVAGVAVWAAVLWAMLWGLLVTPHTLEVRKVQIACDRLPAAFDGYRIVQWSDAHLGTENGKTAFVQRYVNVINDLHPDMICFTGDLVSRLTAEAEPYRDILSQLHAPDGIYSVLGNHDYDDYAQWDDAAAMRTDRQALCDLQAQLGWRLLNNDHVSISRGNDRIVVIGTENWGDHPYDKRGNLSKAYAGLKDRQFKIQLQHNPYAWRAYTLTNSNIDLTLAGHTHAWQVMLKLGKHRLSPARLRYREWGGLYSDGYRHLYVNTGVGMVGTPMRIGATPEITLITLKKKKP